MQPTGDELLDPVLKEIAGDTHEHTPRYWVERIAARRAEAISDAAFDRLVKQGILDHDSGGYWSLSHKVARTGRYPLVDGSPGEEIKGRITRVLLSNEIPDPRDIAIIGLLHNCGGVKTLLEPEEFEAAEQRIELLSGMDLIGRTIGPAVASSYRPPEALRTVRRQSMPTMSLKHFRDPDKFDIDRYLPPREEHRQAGAYAPFGTGTHICAGRRWTELQLVLNVLLIARHLELEMVPKDYKLKLNPFPKLSPAKSFKYRVTGHRHAIGTGAVS